MRGHVESFVRSFFFLWKSRCSCPFKREKGEKPTGDRKQKSGEETQLIENVVVMLLLGLKKKKSGVCVCIQIAYIRITQHSTRTTTTIEMLSSASQPKMEERIEERVLFSLNNMLCNDN